MSTRTSAVLLAIVAIVVMWQPAQADAPWITYTTNGLIGALGVGNEVCSGGAPPGERPLPCGRLGFGGNEVVTPDPDPTTGSHISSFPGSVLQLSGGGYCAGVMLAPHATGEIQIEGRDQFGESMFITSVFSIAQIRSYSGVRHFGVCSDEPMETVHITDPADGRVEYDAAVAGFVLPEIVEKCATTGAPFIIVLEDNLPPRLLMPEANGCAYYTPFLPDQPTVDIGVTLPPAAPAQ